MAPKAVLRKCGEGRFYLQDRLSELPDSLLISILSRLSMNEAARTSVLSRSWRDLWTYAIRGLDLDASQSIWQLPGTDAASLDFWRNKYIEWVNKVLISCNGPTIDEFRVFFDLGCHRSKPYLDNWINFALEKSVRKLELNLSCLVDVFSREFYVLTLPFLQNCKLDSLTCISLNTVEVTEEVVEYILSCCSFLECLTVVTSASLVNLKVSGPSLKLKHLKILYCSYVQCIEISAPSLISFKYYGPEAKIIFKDVPCLVEASFAGLYVPFLLKNLLQNLWCLSQLRTLALNVICLKQKFFHFPRFPKLRNLKEVELSLVAGQIIDVLRFMSPLKACPMLHRLSMKILPFGNSGARKLKMMKLKRAHKCLKVIELIGFRGYKTEAEFIWYIINNTVALEKIVIDPSFRPHEDGGFPMREFNEAARTRARQLGKSLETRARQLGKSLPPGLELVIL